MNSRITVADARAALYELVTPEDPDSARFLRVLNEVVERYINNAKWKGNLMEVTFNGAEGYVTLPYNYASALAGTYIRCPFPIFTQYHTFVENGPGNIEEAFKWSGILLDMGDGFATQVDIDDGDAGVLRVYSSASDNATVVRIYGLDENGATIYDSDGNEGEQVTLAAPFVATTHSFSRVTGFTKPHTDNAVRIAVVPPSVAEYTLSTYQPNETRPSYHRYQTGTVQEESNAENGIKLLCSRRFIPLQAETDWVIPGNLAALRNGIQAWNSENATDYVAANAAWNRGLDFLNDEAKTYRGGGRPTVNVEGFGLSSPFVNVA
jgi:hypothetical protein